MHWEADDSEIGRLPNSDLACFTGQAADFREQFC